MRTTKYKDGLIGPHPRKHCCSDIAGIPLEAICPSFGSRTPLYRFNNCTCEDFLYCRFVVMGAFSSNHYHEAQDMIGSVQTNLPYTRLVVYDLGLSTTEKAQLATYCNVEVRPLNFTKYKPYVKHLEKFAWKPIITSELSKEYEVILYGDSSMRVKEKFAEKFLPLLLDFPFVSGPPAGHAHPITIYTHDAMLNYLRFNLSREMAAEKLDNSLQTVSLVWFTKLIKEKWLKRWLDCALHEECIAPPGSSPYGCKPHRASDKGRYIGCHRFDMSALNVIIYQEFGQTVWKSCAHSDLCDIIRGVTHKFKLTSDCDEIMAPDA